MNKGFLIDMDGVVYRGSELIAGAVEFIDRLVERKIPFMFLTNNSQRTPIDIATRLQRLGFKVSAEHVYTSAMATASYLAHQNPQGTAYVIGEGGLLTALNGEGYAVVDSNPDYVVIGEGRTMTLENMEKAVQMVADGARLIATNLDPSCPTQDGGVRPGCGAYVRTIEEATGFKAFSPGKPSPVIFREARKQLDLRSGETIMIGDTMETDILGAVQLGYTGILVLSGGTQEMDLRKFAYKPDYVVQSVANIDDKMLEVLLSDDKD
ncbi:HAD-IIA family hydrolase [Pseudobacteriovorax antillogorgiicola]|uniref:NagD protein n=1 Tax=Pseudobacteriovorax antillogorgiicola TaxID=1513793 RepID=A0A1Y6C1G5_9BACT|nr:HAD-IIA family hydrolase [Pseudobacteriovorax antillogorgiicola]TCS52422.1 NagD protein [Pseudobacteriovorax antillogorgiicola]SMF28802.1 NagD protein [Pseudobacteriovorax antillogorgiicola]